jgi:hypothetical protein
MIPPGAVGSGFDAWRLLIECASLLSGVAGPWLLVLYQRRTKAMDELIKRLGQVDESLKSHKLEDRRNFKRIKKALKRIVKQFCPPDQAARPAPRGSDD